MSNEDIKILSDGEIKEKLSNLEGWKYDDNKITKTFEFSSFGEAIEFVSNLVAFCNNLNHHPDIKIEYQKVTFDLTRYDLGGKVTNFDFIVAEEIERRFNE